MPIHATSRRRGSGFTLIELLVVIAIIAILAAILLPVFMGAKEKARQSTVLDHFRQISEALAKYKLDHHSYPTVLFGYATAGTTIPMKGAQPNSGLTGQGLYPLYINNPSVFTDPNDPVGANTAQTQQVAIHTLSPSGVLTSSTATFYTADAFDANPLLSAPGTISPTTPVARYQLAWTSYPPTAPYTAQDATRELTYPNPSADTFVTCTTYHAGSGIGQGKVLVLFEGGNAQVMDDKQFLANGPDGGTTPTFWTVNP